MFRFKNKSINRMSRVSINNRDGSTGLFTYKATCRTSPCPTKLSGRLLRFIAYCYHTQLSTWLQHFTLSVNIMRFHGRLAQLARASHWRWEGRGFEFLIAHQNDYSRITYGWSVCFPLLHEVFHAIFFILLMHFISRMIYSSLLCSIDIFISLC